MTCEVSLQNLIHHTASRLIEFLKMNNADDHFPMHTKLIYKLGCDGSNVPVYKQKAQDNALFTGGIFISSLVPLQLTDKENNRDIWLIQDQIQRDSVEH